MFFPVDYGEVNLCFSVNDLREYVPFCSGFIMFTCNHCDHLSFAFVCFFFYKYQRAKKVLSDSLGLVDFAIGLANSVFNLPDGQVMF